MSKQIIWILIVLALLIWGVSAYFFFKKPNLSQGSPASEVKQVDQKKVAEIVGRLDKLLNEAETATGATATGAQN